MSQPQRFVGIEVAQAHRDIALRPTAERWTVSNDDAGIAALSTRRQEMAPQRMGREATGTSQRAVVAALAAAGLPVVVVQPRHARDCATAPGQRAQTDGLEARAFAPCAAAVRPPPRLLPDAQTEERRARLARRRQLIALRTAEQHRLGSAPRRLQTAIAAPRTWLQERLTALDDDLDTTRRARPVWREVCDHGVEQTGRASRWVIQLTSGVFPWNRHETASTSIGHVGRPRMRQG